MKLLISHVSYFLDKILNILDSSVTSQRAIIFSRLALIAIIIVIVLAILLSYNNYHERIIYGQDFRCFYGAGKILLDGDHGQLYNTETQLNTQEEMGFYQEDSWPMAPYLNPPVFAWVMQFFSILPHLGAVTLWRIISILAVAISLKKIIKSLKIDLNPWNVVIMILASFPGFMAIYNGQNTFFFLTIYIWIFLLLSREKDFYAGSVLGLGFFKPQLFWMMPILLLVQKKWWALAGAFFTFSFFFLASIYIVGIDGVLSYFDLLNSSEYNWFVNWRVHDMHSLAAFLSLSSGKDLGAINHVIITAVLIFVFAGYLKLTKIHLNISEMLIISILGTLLLNPHLFHYDLTLMTLPYLIMFTWTKEKTVGKTFKRNLRVGMLMLYFYLWISPVVIQLTGLQLSVLLLIYLLFITFKKVSRQSHYSTTIT